MGTGKGIESNKSSFLKDSGRGSGRERSTSETKKRASALLRWSREREIGKDLLQRKSPTSFSLEGNGVGVALY